MTDQKEQKKISKPGQKPFKVGLVLLIVGVLWVILNVTSTTMEYVGGRMVETNGSPSALGVLLIVAGVILASLGYLKKR